MNWDMATDIILYTAIATVGIFGFLGLYQWISRKSLKKVDRALLAMLIPLALMVITYVVFDKFLILNTRPDGSGEPSFPSTHTMIVATVFLCAAMILPQYIKQKSLNIAIDVIFLTFIVIVSIGRVLANKHWTSDVIAGLIFALIFAGIYLFIVKKLKKSKKFTQSDAKN